MDKDILIIDDEKWFFEPILDELDFEEFTYDFCENGSKGLAKLNANNYKVLILDMKLPFGDQYRDCQYYDALGLCLLEDIKELNPNLPVLCYTIYTDTEIVNRIKELGGKHIPKGFGDSTLINEIKKIIK